MSGACKRRCRDTSRGMHVDGSVRSVEESLRVWCSQCGLSLTACRLPWTQQAAPDSACLGTSAAACLGSKSETPCRLRQMQPMKKHGEKVVINLAKQKYDAGQTGGGSSGGRATFAPVIYDLGAFIIHPLSSFSALLAAPLPVQHCPSVALPARSSLVFARGKKDGEEILTFVVLCAGMGPKTRALVKSQEPRKECVDPL